MCAVRKGNASGESSTVKGVWDMPELRTREVEDLLEVFAGLTRPDDVFALLEDLFTVREIKDTSQRLDVARMLRKGSSYAVSKGQPVPLRQPSPACRRR